jgi:hypothetical protein
MFKQGWYTPDPAYCPSMFFGTAIGLGRVPPILHLTSKQPQLTKSHDLSLPPIGRDSCRSKSLPQQNTRLSTLTTIPLIWKGIKNKLARLKQYDVQTWKDWSMQFIDIMMIHLRWSRPAWDRTVHRTVSCRSYGKLRSSEIVITP